MKLMIVDDDILLQKMLGDVLKKYGFSILFACDGNDGLKTAIREFPDLIVTDIEMPNMDGLAMVKSLRSMKDFSDTPIIVMSSIDSSEEALSVGCTKFFRKSSSFFEDIVNFVKNTPSN